MIFKLLSRFIGTKKRLLIMLLFVSSLGFSQSNILSNDCQGKTFTQGGWGASNGTPWQVNYLYHNFNQAFPNGLSIGCNTGFKLQLNSAQAVTAFLPSGGTPSILNQNYTDPTNYTNTLAGQLVSLTLAIIFDTYDTDFSSPTASLGNYIITQGIFQGYSVNQFLQEANNFIGGCGNSNFSASDYNATATAINENFDNGTIDNGFLSCCILKTHISFEPIKCFGGTTLVHVTATGASTNATGIGDVEVQAGTHTFTVIDGNCKSSITITITQPEELITSVDFTPILCNGGQSTVSVSATGGTAPYSGIGTFIVSAGTYTYTITDANGCTDTISTTITQPDALSLSITGEDVMCYGGKTTITANTAGGTPPYTYLWNTGETTPSISVGVGTYTATITDANGCIISTSFTVKQKTCDGFTTITQGGWGAKAAGNNWGTYRDQNFSMAFPDGLTVGAGTRFLKFTSAKAIDDFLPSSTTARILNTGTLTNPGTNYKNILAGQVVALSLSVKFDEYDINFSPNAIRLGDLIVISGTFEGWSVYQVLAEANKVLGGITSAYTPAQMNTIVDAINNNYNDGKINLGLLACPCNTNKRATSLTPVINAKEISNKTTQPEVKLFPNPSSGEINLKFEMPKDEKVFIQIFDLKGNLLGDFSNKVIKSNKQGILHINNLNLTDGLYLVKIKTTTVEKTIKFMIHK